MEHRWCQRCRPGVAVVLFLFSAPYRKRFLFRSRGTAGNVGLIAGGNVVEDVTSAAVSRFRLYAVWMLGELCVPPCVL